ncbi:FAD-dependent oxidoreductase [Chitinophaga sancti]|uniref:FAD-dependent oxidoreductase n=1 Tax=Chitinophaga sancti TaxID=1004 RepID=A0A1K1SRD2_9BACT|nr:FAD-dependent oxidoreductase [Chitinophaga sancti]WQD61052.1 FAD-dependent oxidoreductase [Chitinophaga sancti]WQG86819.1 FAD-dependent oxidoreductase [Chitinophaga sancti]SFW86623.1 thioredoxin reductase (NADPH) [Chitinophaga sancti]
MPEKDTEKNTNQPIILCIDDDPQVLRAIVRDIKNKYRQHYKIISTADVQEALNSLLELKNKGETIAMFISDQRMPVMDGVTFLEKALKFYPDAKRVLLTAYSDTDAAIKAINTVQLDYYLVKPWDPPEDKLYPVIDDLLDDWKSDYHPEFKGIKVVGYQYSRTCHAIKDFLAGNLIPYKWLDVRTTQEACKLLALNGLDEKDVPVIFFEDGTYLSNPSIQETASKVGLNPQIKHEVYDVVIIGAGPAGLAAGVYGASEGLKTLLIEKRAPGGQAGTSSRIENYLGFPKGLSGADLARRAISQAQRLGTEFITPQSVKAIEQKDGYNKVIMEDGTFVNSRSVVITTGVDYRTLDTKGVADFTGAGIYYGAAMTEAPACKDKDVFIVGGGNSAGQAAMYLSKFARNVSILIRREDLSSTMSAYLVDRIVETPNIHVRAFSEVVEARGSDRLECLVISNIKTGEQTQEHADGLYIFIGAKPFTEWLEMNIIKNDKGFIETGRDLFTHPEFEKIWKQERDPYLLETSCPGIFAAGDVRANAMNRVAAAVGEGSMAISFVHKYLAEVK